MSNAIKPITVADRFHYFLRKYRPNVYISCAPTCLRMVDEAMLETAFREGIAEGKDIAKQLMQDRMDAIDKQRQAGVVVSLRCALCNYQHGHMIGCANNPVDKALKAKNAAKP